MKKQLYTLIGFISIGSAAFAMNPSNDNNNNNNNVNNNNAKVALAPYAAHFSTVNDRLQEFGNKTKSGNDRKFSNTKFNVTTGIAQQLINFVTQKQPDYKNRAEVEKQWNDLKIMGATFETAKEYAQASRKLGIINPVIAFAAEQNFYDATKKQWKEDSGGLFPYDPSVHYSLSSDQLNKRRYDLLKQHNLLLPGKGFWQGLFTNKNSVAKDISLGGNYTSTLRVDRENKTMKGLAAVEERQSVSGLTISSRIGHVPAKPMSILGSEIAQFPQLQNLFINFPFKRLPDELSMLSHLKSVALTRANLNTIPSEVFNCPQLEYLGCSENNITSISPAIEKLRNLKTLDISANKLTLLPEEFTCMPLLNQINATSNPLITPLSATMKTLVSKGVLKIDNLPSSIVPSTTITMPKPAHALTGSNNNNNNNNNSDSLTKYRDICSAENAFKKAYRRADQKLQETKNIKATRDFFAKEAAGDALLQLAINRALFDYLKESKQEVAQAMSEQLFILQQNNIAIPKQHAEVIDVQIRSTQPRTLKVVWQSANNNNNNNNNAVARMSDQTRSKEKPDFVTRTINKAQTHPASQPTIAQVPVKQEPVEPKTPSWSFLGQQLNDAPKALLPQAEPQSQSATTPMNVPQINSPINEIPMAQAVTQPEPTFTFAQEWQSLFEPMDIQPSATMPQMPVTTVVPQLNKPATTTQTVATVSARQKHTLAPKTATTTTKRIRTTVAMSNDNNNNNNRMIVPAAARARAAHSRLNTAKPFKTVHDHMLKLAKQYKDANIELKEIGGSPFVNMVVSGKASQESLLKGLLGYKNHCQPVGSHEMSAEYQVLVPSLVSFIDDVESKGLKITYAPPQLNK